ncbi:MAG TPA: helix-turn-helix transcriptional regulator [Candidatus Faecousia intestinigallinarum]|nr:helix-turn-helix transcriptional regulator [Candidatus Faecousia intestinigallinarum]
MLKNLRELRRKCGMTQKELGNVVGLTQQTINKYENGNAEPNIRTLIALADYFETSVDYLIGRTSE